ncbi:MAG: imidazolonepropionase [Chloroflexota bacterium]|nr:imidazolonepropionase [Chloroflexota bacterium]
MQVDLLIHNIGELVTIAGANEAPRRGAGLRELGIIHNGAVAVSGQEIVAVGPTDVVHSIVEVGAITQVIDGTGKTVIPGFVDPHTHLVFAGTREHEYTLRLAGATYEEILSAGGGINYTTRLTRAGSEEELFDIAWEHLNTMLGHGTTTVEAKSGYGLEVESEVKLLRVIRRLDEAHPIDLVPTFLGAHLVPSEYRDRPDKYVRVIIEEMLPRVANEGLAKYCDVWCDEGIFTVEQSRRMLERARSLGMRLRVHANQLASGGGTRLAVGMGADSVDHLERLPEDAIELLAKSDTIATLLPGVAFTLGGPYAEARTLIDRGTAVALATDFNPGSCFTESMPIIIALACSQLRMTPAEAIVASTINAAWSLNRADRIGSLEPGKQADLVLFDMPNHAHLPYHFGVNLVHAVVKAGRIVVEDGKMASSLRMGR